jgi:plastocyanin
MNKKFAALIFAGIAALTACGGGYGGGGSSTYNPPPSNGGGGTPPPGGLGADTIGIALPNGMGTVNTQFGMVGGYTQSTYSQTLAFPPGTKVTIKNLASSDVHTLNVLSMSSFPANPALSSAASGGSTLAMGWASGAIQPGSSVTVTLSNPGTYFIGCAFHYITNGMRDVLQVSNSAQPGPQATPPASGSGGAPGGCAGVYC